MADKSLTNLYTFLCNAYRQNFKILQYFGGNTVFQPWILLERLISKMVSAHESKLSKIMHFIYYSSRMFFKLHYNVVKSVPPYILPWLTPSLIHYSWTHLNRGPSCLRLLTILIPSRISAGHIETFLYWCFIFSNFTSSNRIWKIYVCSIKMSSVTAQLVW